MSDYSSSRVAGTLATLEVVQNGSVVDTHTVNLDAIGGYSFETFVTGTAQIRVKAAHWLAKVQNVELSNDAYVNFSLINGDINGDNKINILDYAVLKANYNKIGVGDNAADLNGDGNINVLDYSILKKNYNVIGQ